MFLILLGGALLVGWGLLAAASYTEGSFVDSRSAAQAIGWLLAGAALVGLYGLRNARWGKVAAATVTFLCAAALLYVSYFEWNHEPTIAAPVAASPEWNADYKIIPVVAAVGVLASTGKAKPSAAALKPVVATPAKSPSVADACFAREGLEFLQCNRCGDLSGLRGVMCREVARAEYCAERPRDEAICPTAVSYSPPG